MLSLENFEWGAMDYVKDQLTEEIFTDQMYTKIVDVKEGDIVVDIGASVGPFTYSILHKKPLQVYAIEPSKSEFSSLVKNTRGYPVSHVNKAIWNKDDVSDSNEHRMEWNGTYYDKHLIETMKFDTFRKMYSIEKINFLKSDCEGGEYHIFNEDNIGFLVSNVDFIVCEWHLESPERKELFRNFRDNYIPLFKSVHVFDIDGLDIKWELMEEHFIQYYNQVIIHIDNRKN